MLPPTSAIRLGLSGLRSTLQKSTATTSFASRVRTFASVLPDVPTASSSSTNVKLPGNVKDARQPGALRPHLGVEVDPKHGLYAFFRKKEENGVTKYETVEPASIQAQSGRAWTAAELRRKSFKDLHTLWYVLLRERNLLATQREEGRRMGTVQNKLDSHSKVYRVRKSMARIKYVLNERRLAYEGAVDIIHGKISKRMAEREARRQRHQAGMALAEEKAKAKELAERSGTKPEQTDDATKLAVAGLLETAPSS